MTAMYCPTNEDKRAAARERLFHPTMVRVVLRWLERLGVPMRDRDDAGGQVWLLAWQSWPTFDPARGRPERWLNAITVHVAAHYHERAKHRPEELVSEPVELVDPAPDAVAVMVNASTRMQTLDALNELDRDLRVVLASHDIDGIPMAHLAVSEGVPLSTLYKRRIRAKAALRAALDGRERAITVDRARGSNRARIGPEHARRDRRQCEVAAGAG